MTRDKIEQLSGEALRVAVAEHVFAMVWTPPIVRGAPRGWTERDGSMNRWTMHDSDSIPTKAKVLPRYESDTAAAFEVVERMRERGTVRFGLMLMPDGRWYVDCDIATTAQGLDSDESLPAAICRAALMAVERSA